MGYMVATGPNVSEEQKAANARAKAAGSESALSTLGRIPGGIIDAVNPFSQGQVNFQGSNAQLGSGGQWGQAGMAQANRSGAQGNSAWSGDQRFLADHLRGQMSGQNSLSVEQLRQDSGRNIAMQQALAASAGPQNAAMAQRMASQNAGRINQGMAGQAAMAGIAERNAAAQALGGLAGQARGQDMSQQFGAQQLDDARWQSGMGLGLNAAQSNLGAQTAQDQMRLQQALAQAQMPSANQQLAGAVLGGAQTYAQLFPGTPATAAPPAWDQWGATDYRGK